MSRFQLRCRGLCRLLPGNGEQLVAPANQRLANAFLVIREITTEASFDAQKITVDSAQVAVVRAQNLVIAHAQRGFASVRTVRANCRYVLHLPRPRFVAIRPARECAHRADIDTHPALFALEVIAAVRDDYAVRAA